MLSNYLTKLIHSILKNNPESRDDYMIVIKTIHDFEMSALRKNKDEYYDCFFSNKVSNFQTITRIWRKIQEDVPELRGEQWELRQIMAGKLKYEFVADNQLKLFEN